MTIVPFQQDPQWKRGYSTLAYLPLTIFIFSSLAPPSGPSHLLHLHLSLLTSCPPLSYCLHSALPPKPLLPFPFPLTLTIFLSHIYSAFFLPNLPSSTSCPSPFPEFSHILSTLSLPILTFLPYLSQTSTLLPRFLFPFHISPIPRCPSLLPLSLLLSPTFSSCPPLSCPFPSFLPPLSCPFPSLLPAPSLLPYPVLSAPPLSFPSLSFLPLPALPSTSFPSLPPSYTPLSSLPLFLDPP